jgi:hypothetical protein
MTTFGPLPSQVYQDPLLGNLSVAYKNPNYVADLIFPEVQVAKVTGVYFTYDKSKFVAPNTLRAPSTRANRVSFGLTKTAYGPLLEHSLEQDIPDEVLDQQQAPFDANIDTTEDVTERILLDKEIDAYNQLSTGPDKTLSGTDMWSDYAHSDPLQDVQLAMDTIQKNALVHANVLLLSYPVFAKLRHHPAIIERVKYSMKGFLDEALLAEAFDVDTVIVAKAEKNTANEAQTAVMSYIWGKDACLLYVSPTPGIRSVTYGYTLRRGPRVVERWDERAVKAQFVRVTDWYEQMIVASAAKYYIASAIA